MWKWIVGIVLLGFLACAGIVGGGGWWWWQRLQAERVEAQRLEVEKAKAAEQEAEQQAEAAERAARLDEARARYVASDWEAATSAYTDVLRDDPANTEALLHRGRSLARMDRLAMAADDLRQYTAAKPQDKEGWEALAWVLAHNGQDTEAVAAYGKLLALDPQNAKALRERANSRYQAGDVAGALADADQACTLGLTEGCDLKEKMRAATR